MGEKDKGITDERRRKGNSSISLWLKGLKKTRESKRIEARGKKSIDEAYGENGGREAKGT